MKVTTRAASNPGRYVRVLLALSLSMALSLGAFVPTAGAITRDQVLKRANTWVAKRIKYSQRGYFNGYRRDCSGFVSMAWGLGKSYTTRSISSRAQRVKIKNLKPGDAVLKPGRHVSIFGGWKSKRKRTYYAIEQTTWGSTAKRHVKKIPKGAKGLRLRGIQDAAPVAAAPAPAPAPTTAPATTDVPVVNAAVLR